jgi:hypothetical protein
MTGANPGQPLDNRHPVAAAIIAAFDGLRLR